MMVLFQHVQNFCDLVIMEIVLANDTTESFPKHALRILRFVDRLSRVDKDSQSKQQPLIQQFTLNYLLDMSAVFKRFSFAAAKLNTIRKTTSRVRVSLDISRKVKWMKWQKLLDADRAPDYMSRVCGRCDLERIDGSPVFE